ncbi:hypothetical protein ACFLRI_04435 [Bacteroidota bacterium]
MLKFYRNISLLLLPFIIGAFVILFIPYNKQFAYKTITGGCSVEFAYHRIFEDTTALQIAFMGSSKTYNGINDLLINFLFETEYHIPQKVANIAFCGAGRNIHYAFLKELFKYKTPETLIIEVRENETNEGHLSFGVVADAPDIICQRFKGFDSYTKDVFNGVKSRFDYLLWGRKDTSTYKGPFHGFVPNNSQADTAYLNYFKNRKLQQKEKFYMGRSNSKYSLFFLDKIVNLANQHNCKVFFLYLPSFGFIENNIDQKDYYIRNGELLIPPPDIINNVNYWSDQNHLNRSGADSISCWVASELSIRIKQQQTN